MKKAILALFLLPLLGLMSFQGATTDDNNSVLPKRNKGAFKAGEFLKFRIHYGFIDAGYGTLEVLQDGRKFGGGRSCLRIVGKGNTAGGWDWVFKVRDKYESWVDEEAIVPWFHIRDVREGKFKFFETDNFNHYNGTVTNESGKYKIPEGTQDIVTSLYYTRSVYSREMKEGDIINLKAFFDNSTSQFQVKFLGRETLNTDIGKVRCLKFRPSVLSGRVFKEQESLTIWVSDDANYVPIRMEAKILVGSVKLDLIEYRGLANPFSALISTR